MSWGTAQTVRECQPSIEEEGKRLAKEIDVAKGLIDAIDELCKMDGKYQLRELGLDKGYGIATMELKILEEQWADLEKRVKKEEDNQWKKANRKKKKQ